MKPIMGSFILQPQNNTTHMIHIDVDVKAATTQYLVFGAIIWDSQHSWNVCSIFTERANKAWLQEGCPLAQRGVVERMQTWIWIPKASLLFMWPWEKSFSLWVSSISSPVRCSALWPHCFFLWGLRHLLAAVSFHHSIHLFLACFIVELTYRSWPFKIEIYTLFSISSASHPYVYIWVF